MLAAVFMVTGGKFYYVAPVYVPFLAAAGVWLEQGGRPRRRLMMALAVVGILVGLPLALPLLPVERLQPVNELNNELGETVGWPQLVDQVDAVVRSLPEAERAEAVIFTGNYGEAGALELLAGAERLPPVMSGHNSYRMWGPVEGEGPIIGVGPVGEALQMVCLGVEQVGVIDNGFGVDNEEQGYPLLLCRDPHRSLAEVWDQVRHFN